MKKKLTATAKAAARLAARAYRTAAATPPEALGGFARFQLVIAAFALGVNLILCAIIPWLFSWETALAMLLYAAVAAGVVIADRHGVYSSSRKL